MGNCNGTARSLKSVRSELMLHRWRWDRPIGPRSCIGSVRWQRDFPERAEQPWARWFQILEIRSSTGGRRPFDL